MQKEYDALVASSVYKEFMQTHPTHYLVNVFILYSKQYTANWQFGFFDEEADMITAFVVTEKDGVFVVEKQEQDDVTKEPTAKLLELELADVSITGEQALNLAIECCEKEYQADAAQSRILLLQHTAEHGVIWNATVISSTFDVVNVKVDAKLGEIKAHSKHSLLDMQANRA